MKIPFTLLVILLFVASTPLLFSDVYAQNSDEFEVTHNADGTITINYLNHISTNYYNTSFLDNDSRVLDVQQTALDTWKFTNPTACEEYIFQLTVNYIDRDQEFLEVTFTATGTSCTPTPTPVIPTPVIPTPVIPTVIPTPTNTTTGTPTGNNTLNVQQNGGGEVILNWTEPSGTLNHHSYNLVVIPSDIINVNNQILYHNYIATYTTNQTYSITKLAICEEYTFEVKPIVGQPGLTRNATLTTTGPACLATAGPPVTTQPTTSPETPDPITISGDYIRSGYNDKYIDLSTYSYAADGGNVHLWGYHGHKNQQWSYDSTTKHLTTGLNSIYCLDISEISSANNQNIQIWGCLGADNQKWDLIPFGSDGGFIIQSYLERTDDFSVCLTSGDGRGNGAALVSSQCDESAKQVWHKK